MIFNYMDDFYDTRIYGFLLIAFVIGILFIVFLCFYVIDWEAIKEMANNTGGG